MLLFFFKTTLCVEPQKWALPGGSDDKASACNAGDLGWEDPLEKEMATHTRILAWEFRGQWSLVGYSPWSCRVRHNLATKQHHRVNGKVHFLDLFLDSWGKAHHPNQAAWESTLSSMYAGAVTNITENHPWRILTIPFAKKNHFCDWNMGTVVFRRIVLCGRLCVLFIF